MVTGAEGLVGTGERMVRANGVDLCVATFGEPADPAILLIGGAGSSMDWWEDEFCERLAAGYRYVIRYDSRDTGRSTGYAPGAPPYGIADLTADAVCLLDVLGVDRAHLAGISMGAMIALGVALDHGRRVRSLTLLSTSPAGPGGPDNGLPPMSAGLLARFAEQTPPPDWTDRPAVIDHIVESRRAFAGSLGFDIARLRRLAGRVFDRTTGIEASMTNHWRIEGGDPIRPRLAGVSVPTLVMHGTEDPLFPVGHAEAMAGEIPGASLVLLDGVGHQTPPPEVWDVAIPALLRHTSGGWDEQGDRLASRSLAAGDATGWFDRLYTAGAAGEVEMPWDRREPHGLLVRWAGERGLTGAGRRAIVVGCGLGADAEYVAGLGFDTVAFDVADTAVQLARRRFPGSAVRYVTADLLDPPAEWSRAFDLVVEIITVQALPRAARRDAIVNVGRLVGPGGTLIVIAAVQDEHAAPASTPPWPLTRDEIGSFAADGLTAVRIEIVPDARPPARRRWQAEFHR